MNIHLFVIVYGILLQVRLLRPIEASIEDYSEISTDTDRVGEVERLVSSLLMSPEHFYAGCV